MAVDGKALAMALGGGVLLWTGLTSPTGNPRDIVTDVLTGKKPPAPGTAPAINPGAGSGGGGATGSTSAIAQNALASVGHCYRFGGAPGADYKGCWDCSSAASSWLVQAGLPIPGYDQPGSWNRDTHGPTTLSYLAWARAETVGHHGADTQPGDLCVWQTHMGVAIGNGQMVSAQNPASGTQVSGIDGFIPGEVLFIRRVIIGSSRG